MEWGYAASNDDESTTWSSVDKTVLSEAPEGIEKMIGFEGKPDPGTGFYCVSGCSRQMTVEVVCCCCCVECVVVAWTTVIVVAI